MDLFKSILALSLILIIASSCGQGIQTTHSVGATPVNNSPSDTKSQEGTVAGKMEPSLSIQQKDQTLHFIFSVKNKSDHTVTYHFNTSQTYDYVIKDAQGKIIRQFSKGRMFAQHTSTTHINQGEALTYQSEIRDLPQGSYTMTIWLTANNHKPKLSQRFTITDSSSHKKSKQNTTQEKSSQPIINNPANNKNTETKNHGGIVAGKMVPSLSIHQINQEIDFTFNVKNQTEHVMTYTFNTSQTYDYVIKDAKGNTVKKYSEGRMFAMHTSTVHVKQGDALTYHDTVKDLPKGSYTMTIWLTANEGKPKSSQNFDIK